MKTLLDPAIVQQVKARFEKLKPDSPRQWGKMNPAQAMAHCSLGIEMALGNLRPPRKLIGRFIGPIIKPLVFRDDEPMRRNSPTVEGLVVQDERDIKAERIRLCELVDRFVADGPTACTTHPHAFFGRLTPEQWSILMYKHLDHHLRQFGA
jgi:Protein of unknown function (DUF1569)